MTGKDERGPDCFRCRHFQVTYQPAWPYACRAFGVRSKVLPSIEIRRASGAPCRGFEPKEDRERSSRRRS